MKPITEKISFYPFSFQEIQEGFYSIIRYNIVKHDWEEIGKETCLPSEIDESVQRLNEEAGKITEFFIVDYVE